MKDKFRGSLLWTAVGDAAGAPFEFRPLKETRAKLRKMLGKYKMLETVNRLLRTRSWTDDTQLSVCHLRSLVRKNGFCPEDTAKELMENALKRQGSGGCTRRAIARLKNGASWDESGETNPANAGGNGPAMKVAPLALFYHHDLDKLHDVCREASMITHNCPEAFAGSRAVAYIVAKAAAGNLDHQSIIEETIEYVGDSETAEKLKQVQELIRKNEEPGAALKEIGTGGYIVETVGASFYCYLTSPERPHISILRAILCGKDTDTTAAIVGAIHGAESGTSRLPKLWFKSLEANEALQELAERSYECWQATFG